MCSPPAITVSQFDLLINGNYQYYSNIFIYFDITFPRFDITFLRSVQIYVN